MRHRGGSGNAEYRKNATLLGLVKTDRYSVTTVKRVAACRRMVREATRKETATIGSRRALVITLRPLLNGYQFHGPPQASNLFA
jgi:hypothetical protein